jgi:hypothetical protein
MKRTDGKTEILRYTRYYEQDGKLRAYANRAMLLTTLFAIVATGALGFAVFVRLQPPTVIRVDSAGNATVVGHRARIDSGPTTSLVLETQVSAEMGEAAPTPLEGKAVVRRFLEHYLAYTPDSVDRSFAESLNMMTSNLRTFTLNTLRDQDTVGKIKEDHIISDFRIRSIDQAKDAPWTYVVFGVKEVHRVRNTAEVIDRIVGRYDVRLAEEQRSERNPSGLVIAEYSERQMVGDREAGLLQQSTLEKQR